MQRAYAWQNRLRFVWLSAAVTCSLSFVSLSAWSSLAWSAPATSRDTGDELQKAATWQWPDIAIIEQHFLSYLDQVQAPENVRIQVLEHWKTTAAQDKGPAFLERV